MLTYEQSNYFQSIESVFNIAPPRLLYDNLMMWLQISEVVLLRNWRKFVFFCLAFCSLARRLDECVRSDKGFSVWINPDIFHLYSSFVCNVGFRFRSFTIILEWWTNHEWRNRDTFSLNRCSLVYPLLWPLGLNKCAPFYCLNKCAPFYCLNKCAPFYCLNKCARCTV